jgi:hypothetical protein
LLKLKEMVAVRKGNEATARQRIQNAVKEAVATIQEINEAAPDGVAHREPDIETIRVRAYEIFLARGATHGEDFADWLIAERELRGARNP